MVTSMIAKTITHSTAMTPAKISAQSKSMVKAMTIAPKTTNGERSKSRRPMLVPDCTWLMSLVMRVMSVEEPMVSSSVYESVWICAISA